MGTQPQLTPRYRRASLSRNLHHSKASSGPSSAQNCSKCHIRRDTRPVFPTRHLPRALPSGEVVPARPCMGTPPQAQTFFQQRVSISSQDNAETMFTCFVTAVSDLIQGRGDVAAQRVPNLCSHAACPAHRQLTIRATIRTWDRNAHTSSLAVYSWNWWNETIILTPFAVALISLYLLPPLL